MPLKITRADASLEGAQLPFEEQIAFFRQKVPVPTARWDDLRHNEHDAGFMVAGAMKAELLADLQAAVARTAAGAGTLEEFRAAFPGIVARHGWHGWTGEGTAAGEAWRTRVIYQTNMLTSYAAGRLAQLRDPELRKIAPYWMYRHNDSVMHPRPLHVSWDKLTLPADDPWFQTHYPPNGWGCRCYIVAVSKTLAELQGGRLGPAPDDGIDPKTGGPMGIDKGWDYMPGRLWAPDLDRYPSEIAKAFVAESMAGGVFDRWLGRIAGQVAEALATDEFAGLGKEAAIALLRQRLVRGEEFPVAVMSPDKQALLGVSTQVIKLSDYDAIKQAYSRMGDANFTFDAYRNVQSVMDNAELIIRETGQMTVWFRRDGRLMVAVIQQTQTGKGVFLKSLRFGSEKDKVRSLATGTEIYRT